jgi:site-specific DNA-cytosine methylase
MSKYKILDLFCGAGGCSMGYKLAGLEPSGVDINEQTKEAWIKAQKKFHSLLDGCKKLWIRYAEF